MSGIYAWFGIDISEAEAFRTIQAAGFTSTMLYWSNEFAPIDKSVGQARGRGLQIANGHLPFQGINALWHDGEAGDRYEARIVSLIQEASIACVPTLVLHPSEGPTPPPVNESGLARFHRLVRQAEVHGIQLAIENLRSRVHFDTLLQTFSSLGVCYDSGHNHVVTKDPALLDPYRGRVSAIHLHDNHGLRDDHLLPFLGTIDWEAEMAMLKSVGYNGPILLESMAAPEADPDQYLQACKKTCDRLQVWLDNSISCSNWPEHEGEKSELSIIDSDQ